MATPRYFCKPEYPNDFTLLLKLNRQLLTNSEVLISNGSVFKHIIEDLGLKCHEMDDFDDEAVELFVDFMYSGTVDGLSTSVFRDIYKMANVFDVPWIIAACKQYFKKVTTEKIKIDFDVKFLFGEAEYALNTYKDKYLSDSLKYGLIKTGKTADFLAVMLPSTEVFESVSSSFLTTLVKVMGKQVEMLVNIIQHFVLESKYLTENLKCVLKLIDLGRCFIRDSTTFFSLLDILQGLESLTLEDVKLISLLQSNSSRQVSSMINEKPTTTMNLKIPDPICCRANHYFSKEMKRGMSFIDFLRLFGKIAVVKTFYMFVDGLCFWMHFHAKEIPKWCGKVEGAIIKIRKARGWRKLSQMYLDDWETNRVLIRNFFSSMSECPQLVTANKLPLVSMRQINISDLFTAPTTQTVRLSPPLEGMQLPSLKYTPLSDGVGPEVLFEFVAKDVSDLKCVSLDGEKICPQDMHLSLQISGGSSCAAYKDWTPVPPLSWASGLNWRNSGKGTRFHLKWIEKNDSGISIIDETIHETCKSKIKLYF